MSQQLVNAIADMDEEGALALTSQLLDGGTAPTAILDDCREAMGIVGKRFEAGEYFIPELILAGEMLKSISAEVKPRLVGDHEAKKGAKVVVGTVKGDIHDIGKDIVVFMLDVNGFEVYDLGIDVPVQAFVDKIAEVKPAVVALSGFLTLSYDSMKETVAAIAAAGLRAGVKIMVGGGTVDEQVCKYAGADAFGLDAMAAVSLAKGWTEPVAVAAGVS
ncbi:MAG TPA: cobalamin-dependent protein [Anaerolineae bacterium]